MAEFDVIEVIPVGVELLCKVTVELLHLRRQVTELQTRGTELTLENRALTVQNMQLIASINNLWETTNA